MRAGILLIAVMSAAFAADDPWTKVKELKSGAELRITRDGARQPILAQMDHATDESLFIATKKEQLVIPKSEIQRLEARPQQTGSRVTKTTTAKSNQAGNPSPSDQRPGGSLGGPSSSVSTNYSIGSKPDFENIYRRVTGAPPAQK